uniref:Orf285 n=1 Tax=Helianthus annuus TaxID=4232 RepID=A0A2P1MA95_HELAN|nr:hypothetical protein [Helianthus annuus]AXB74605.1 orf285 [Helianthus annuus]
MKKKKREENDQLEMLEGALITLIDNIFVKFLLCLLLILVSFLIYTYDRSFRVHQQTLLWAHQHNVTPGVSFLYKIRVGHDGTTLDPIPLPVKEHC